MCNLYSQTKGQAAIIAFTRALRDTTGNLPPMPGVFLCGACTHPGGSVIAINGRNAAMNVLAS